MKKVFWSILTIMVVLSVSLPLHADPLGPNDPYFSESGTNWASSWGTGYNPSYQDPFSRMNTLVYFLRPDLFASLTVGDWLINEPSSGTVGDVVRFEFIANSTPVAFIFSDDTGGFGFNHPADVGLPPSYQALNFTTSETAADGTGFTYFPTLGQPGFVSGASWGYGLQSYDYPAVPEPATMLLVGSGLIGLASFGRRFRRTRTLQ